MRTQVSLTLTAACVAFVLAMPATAVAQSGTGSNNSSFLVSGLAQNHQGAVSGGGGGIGIGVKGGLLFSSFKETGESFKNNNGFEAGIFFGGNRAGAVGVMGEILYAKKGAKDSTGTFAVDLYYLEIPVLLRVNLGSANKNKGAIVYVIGGPAFDINLKAQQNNIDVKSNYESLDLGIIGGAGVEISRFLVEGRYNWGLRNVLKANGGTANDVKSRSFALLAGFRFN